MKVILRSLALNWSKILGKRRAIYLRAKDTKTSLLLLSDEPSSHTCLARRNSFRVRSFYHRACTRSVALPWFPEESIWIIGSGVFRCIRLIRGLMDHFDKGVPAPLVQHGHSGTRRTKKSLKIPALLRCSSAYQRKRSCPQFIIVKSGIFQWYISRWIWYWSRGQRTDYPNPTSFVTWLVGFNLTSAQIRQMNSNRNTFRNALYSRIQDNYFSALTTVLGLHGLLCTRVAWLSAMPSSCSEEYHASMVIQFRT